MHLFLATITYGPPDEPYGTSRCWAFAATQEDAVRLVAERCAVEPWRVAIEHAYAEGGFYMADPGHPAILLQVFWDTDAAKQPGV